MVPVLWLSIPFVHEVGRDIHAQGSERVVGECAEERGERGRQQ